MIKRSVLQKDIIILDMYAPNNRAPNYLRQKRIDKNYRKKSMNLFGDFNIPLSEMGRSNRPALQPSDLPVPTIA